MSGQTSNVVNKKSSPYSDCKNCVLSDQPRCLVDTNVDLKTIPSIDVLILAEAPSHEEIKQSKPLVGPAGKIFRQAFIQSGLSNFNYIISNVVLCANFVDGKTATPPDEAIESCKGNWQSLLRKFRPKLVILMGSTAVKAFFGEELLKTIRMTDLRGSIRNYEEFDCLITYHPSYVMRQAGVLESQAGKQFLSDFIKAKNILKGKLEKDSVKTTTADYFTEYGSRKGRILVPEKYYAPEYELLNCQYIDSENALLYTFKTSDKTKEYYYKSDYTSYFYKLRNGISIDDLKQKYFSPYSVELKDCVLLSSKGRLRASDLERLSLEETFFFEVDVDPATRATIDYKYHRNTEEPSYNLRILYMDIEVYTSNVNEFPDPKLAKYPVSSVCMKFSDEKIFHIWCKKPVGWESGVDVKEAFGDDSDNIDLRFFNSERDLLQELLNFIHRENPDIITGWNFLTFDMVTLLKRMLQHRLDITLLSPLRKISYYESSKSGDAYFEVYGLILLDMLALFRSLTYSSEESYSLNYIAKKYLNKEKVQYEGSIDDLYNNDLPRFLLYNKIDVELTEELNLKMRHIEIRRELIKICASTWARAEWGISGLIDPLCLLKLKKKSMVCKTTFRESRLSPDTQIPGAYVRSPIPSLHTYVVDFDFQSLYPSIIRTFNIGPDTLVARILDNEESINVYEMSETAFKIIYDRDSLNLNDDVLVLFNPLYPEDNGRKLEKIKVADLLNYIESEGLIVTISGCLFCGHEKKTSFLAEILTELMEKRKEYKDKMKEAIRENNALNRARFENIQLVYKILANSIYGVLASQDFRFFAPELASTITLTGQEIIKFSGYHMDKMLCNWVKTKDYNSLDQIEVGVDKTFLDHYDDKDRLEYIIYQDTDSIFVSLGKAINKIDSKQ